MLDQVKAILWAQWRTMRNYYPRNLGSLAFAVIMSAMWYGMVTAGALALAALLANPEQAAIYRRFAPTGLLLVFLYWQVIPLLLVSTGASLELKRLRVYPITHRQLFLLEVLLRVTSGVEMMIVLVCAALGLLLNPSIPWWAPLAFLPFVLMNLFLSAGLRDLLSRLLARRGIREVAVLVMVLVMALPQLLMVSGVPDPVRGLTRHLRFDFWPWTAAAAIMLGQATLSAWLTLLAWTGGALAFGRWQFENGLRSDSEAARATGERKTRRTGILERLYRLPSRLFPDPLGAIVEKEIRFLSRAPRFRLVFLMGFTFGLVIWLPLAFRSGFGANSTFASNYLTFVTVYALMLLGEVSFWNTFGFDRSAAQVYYLLPIRLSTVLLGKNIAAAFFVFLEISAVAAVCFALPVPISLPKLVESYAVTLVLSLYMLAVGNLGSVYYPRPVNPAQSWKTASAGRFQAFLLLIYPAVSTPIALAYLARYAFDTQWAFYGVLLFAAFLGGAVYWVAMETAVLAGMRNKERIVSALSQGEGPVSA